MRLRLLPVAFLIVTMLFTLPSRASAQERRVGMTIGYPASVGLQWQATDRFALRVEGSYAWAKNSFGNGETDVEATGTIQGGVVGGIVLFDTVEVKQEFSNQSGSIGVSALFTLTRSDHLRTYLAPRVAVGLSRSTTTMTYSLPPGIAPFTTVPAPRTESNSSSSPIVSGAFGAAAPVSDRFSVFGEIGVSYSRSSSSGSSLLENSGSAVGLRSGIGVMVLF
jgi:hypothetical protein